MPTRRRQSLNTIGGRSIEGERDQFAGLGFSGRSESTKIDEARGCRLVWTFASNVAPRKNLYDEREREKEREVDLRLVSYELFFVDGALYVHYSSSSSS